MKTPSTCRRLVWCLAGMLLLSGCQGTGNTVNFDPRAISTPNRTGSLHGDGLTILVEPFQDARPQQQRLGSRTHFWGGVTNFSAWNGNISEGMANLAIDYLTQRQWQASLAMADQTGQDSSADVKLTGTVLALNANAKSGFGFTDIVVEMKVRFEAKNKIDGSTVRMVLGANGSDTVAIFDPKDVDRLINLVAMDLYKQLFQDLTVKDKAFHLQPGRS
ncbi:MAG: hypothetical protein WD425_04875 [Nitrospirales bacterium]